MYALHIQYISRPFFTYLSFLFLLSIRIYQLLERKLRYESSCLPCRSFGLSVIFSSVTSHAPIGALVHLSLLSSLPVGRMNLSLCLCVHVSPIELPMTSHWSIYLFFIFSLSIYLSIPLSLPLFKQIICNLDCLKSWLRGGFQKICSLNILEIISDF